MTQNSNAIVSASVSLFTAQGVRVKEEFNRVILSKKGVKVEAVHDGCKELVVTAAHDKQDIDFLISCAKLEASHARFMLQKMSCRYTHDPRIDAATRSSIKDFAYFCFSDIFTLDGPLSSFVNRIVHVMNVLSMSKAEFAEFMGGLRVFREMYENFLNPPKERVNTTNYDSRDEAWCDPDWTTGD